MTVHSATILLDQSNLICAASASAATLLGLPPTHLIGRPCSSVLSCCCANRSICPAARARTDAIGLPVQTRTRQSDQVVTVSGQALLAGSQEGHTLLYLQDPDADGPIIRMLERRLLPLSGLGGVMRSALDDLRSFFTADLSAVAIYDSAQNAIRWEMASGNQNPPPEIDLRPGQGFAGRIIASRAILQTTCFPADLTRTPSAYPILVREGLRSALGVPLHKEGTALGVLMIGDRSPRQYSHEVRRAMGAVAEVMALAIENLRLYRDAQSHAATLERQRLAEEIHDGVSQQLFGLKLLLGDMQGTLTPDLRSPIEGALQRICRTLDDSLGEVRRLITGMRGEETRRVDLAAELCATVAEFARTSGLEIELALPTGAVITACDQHEILRIAQEALSNARRHAGARHVQVDLADEPAGYRLQIRDDGCGFDPEAPPPPGHYGLLIMQERAMRAGARLQIDAQPGRGTAVTLHFPT